MSDAKKVKTEAGEAFLASVSPRARAALLREAGDPLAPPRPPDPSDDDDGASGEAFLDSISPAARAALAGAAVAAPPEAAAEELGVRRYAIVESPDGEWAQVRTFKTAEGLARRVQQLEGTDTVVWCFFGVPLALSKGPQRYVELPGGRMVVSVPMYDGGPVQVLERDEIGRFDPEPTGFLGLPELARVQPLKAPAGAAPATGGGDDEEDDE